MGDKKRFVGLLLFSAINGEGIIILILKDELFAWFEAIRRSQHHDTEEGGV